jgi:hypothetical protein
VRKPNLEAIRRRAAAATPGPWKTGDRFGNGALGSAIAVISGNLDLGDLLAWLMADADRARAALDDIRAAGVDPGLLRWCSWPGCLASFNAATGPGHDGWKRYAGALSVLLCPTHVATGHWPGYDVDTDDRTYLAARCGCGETAQVRPARWAAVSAWWEQHLTSLGLLGTGS